MHHSSCFNETFCISYASGIMFHDPGSSHQEMSLFFLRRKVENQIRLGLWDAKYLVRVPLFLRITPRLDSFLRVKINYRISKTFLLSVWPAPVTLIYQLWSLLVLELPLDHVDLSSREIAMIPLLAQLLRRYIFWQFFALHLGWYSLLVSINIFIFKTNYTIKGYPYAIGFWLTVLTILLALLCVYYKQQ